MGSEPEGTSKNLIYEELRRSIISGHLRPGERLNIDALAQHYGVSVTPVRDALQMLSQEGLVTIKPRSGYYVTHLTLKQLRDLFELREVLEVASIERAATRITEEQLEQLENIHRGYVGRDDESIERYARENRRVHCLIAEASGNRELAAMVGHVHDRLAQFFALSGSDELMETRHARLVEALRTRDEAVARQAMRDELDETRRITLERVIEEEGDFWRVGSKSP
jgi:DNA-binding GntR family transcriptional regulator